MAFSYPQNEHVENQNQNRSGAKRLTRRLLPRLSVVAGAAVVAALAFPAPAAAAGTALRGAPVLLSENTLDLLSDETLRHAIERYEAEQQAAENEQAARKQAWRDAQAAAVAAQLEAELAQREAEAAQQALAGDQPGAAATTNASTALSSAVPASGSGSAAPAAAATARAAAAPAPASAAPAAPQIPSGSGFTGVPSVNRQVIYGDIHATQPGQVIDSVDVHGRIFVKADNVTIRNSIVRGADGGSSGGIIDAMQGRPGLKVIDTRIVATTANPSVNGIMGSNFELRNVEIANVIDAVHIAGSNVLIADSWLHDHAHYPAGQDPHHRDGSHDDSVQIVGGSNITITRSILEDSYNAAVMIAPDRSAISNVNITNNRINGGGCSINISEKGKGALPGITVANNTFGYNTRHARCAIVTPTSTSVHPSGNTFADGALVNITKGS